MFSSSDLSQTLALTFLLLQSHRLRHGPLVTAPAGTPQRPQVAQLVTQKRLLLFTLESPGSSSSLAVLPGFVSLSHGSGVVRDAGYAMLSASD